MSVETAKLLPKDVSVQAGPTHLCDACAEEHIRGTLGDWLRMLTEVARHRGQQQTILIGKGRHYLDANSRVPLFRLFQRLHVFGAKAKELAGDIRTALDQGFSCEDDR